MLARKRGAVARGVAAAGLALLVVAVPAFAQETTQPAEYGQGAGVQRARSLPRTGGGPAGEGLPLQLVLAAGAAVGAAGGLAFATRRALDARSSR